MHKITKEYRAEIERYCAENNLSADKLFSSYFSAGSHDLFVLGEGDPERGKLGLADNVPLPIALEIYLESGKLRFVQTDITRKYLGAEEEHDVVHTPRVAVAV
jgi:hypothetical protein